MIAKSETLSRLEMDLPHEILDKLKRAQDILAQKKQMHIDVAQAVDAVLDEFLERHDPIEKAKRAETRSKKIANQLSPKGAARLHDQLSPKGAARLHVTRPVKNSNTALTQKMSPERLVLARKMGFSIPRVVHGE